MDWFDYFELAQEWADGNEAHKRSAVSRAYYAMFCTARNIMGDRYIPPQNGSDHSHLWDLYKQDEDLKPIGVLGTRLKRYRVRADYDNLIVDVDLSDLVEYAMMDAEELKGHLEDLLV